MNDTELRDMPGALIVDLLEAAVRVEGKGQLNVGKWLRASATALARQAGARGGFPRDSRLLASDLRQLSERLRAVSVDAVFCERIALAATVVSRGGFADLARFPDVHVCRRCGTLATTPPAESCASCGAHGLTFERFSTTYWSFEWQPHEVIDRLARNPALFQQALERIPPSRHGRAATATGWSAGDVLRHIRAANELFAERIDLILEQDEPRLVARATHATTDHDPAESAEAVLAAWASVRSAIVARLRSLSPDRWLRTGYHPAHGRVTLAEQASFFAAHELTHLRQLEELRRSPQ